MPGSRSRHDERVVEIMFALTSAVLFFAACVGLMLLCAALLDLRGPVWTHVGVAFVIVIGLASVGWVVRVMLGARRRGL